LLDDLSARAWQDGTLLEVVPFSGEGNPPMGKAVGTELDGRLLTDLSTLTPENPLTPVDRFFIRTRASKLLNTSTPWVIHLGGLINKPETIRVETLANQARSMGGHLIECSGNARTAHFGLMSAAAWDGELLEDILKAAKPRVSGARLLVSGFDRYKEESMTSVAGASWIFSLEQLFSAGAFLATKMNGQPLSADHGAPVRLLVPGWYGCVCIKWVDQIDYVPDDTAATSQMREYAGRTLQSGVPAVAREYQPATMGAVAMPVRIEKWRIAGKVRYRIAGILWGSPRPSHGLGIRFNPGEEFVLVEGVEPPAEDSWSFWSHAWSPPRPGEYTIRMRMKTGNLDTRRLDAGYYDRSVEIAEI
jgi:DMSO/TMAO reductase YedYZ molybdopterin-dependent catalytic subunit